MTLHWNRFNAAQRTEDAAIQKELEAAAQQAEQDLEDAAALQEAEAVQNC